MPTKTRTEITFEKIQRATIRLKQRRLERCRQCAAETAMVTLERAAALTQTTVREIYRSLEEGELHFIEADSGQLLICVTSLGVHLPGMQAFPRALSAQREED